MAQCRLDTVTAVPGPGRLSSDDGRFHDTRAAADRGCPRSLPRPAAGRRAGLAGAGRAGGHRHRGRGGRVCPAPTLRRGGTAEQRAGPHRVAGPDRAARPAAGRAERLGQPAAPRRGPGLPARRGPAERDPAGRAAGYRPGRRHGRLPGRRAGGRGAALRGRRLAALPGGRVPAAVDRAHRAVLDRACRVRRGRGPRPAGLPGTAPGDVRVQRGDVPPGGRARAVDRRQPGPQPLLLDGHGRTPGGRGARRPGRPRARQGHRLPRGQHGAQRPARPALARARRRDAVDVRGPRPRPRPGVVDRPGAGAGRIPGAGRVDRARGPVHARRDRRAGGGAGAARGHRRGPDGGSVTHGAGVPGGEGRRLRVGLVGTGLIAQVMHLHYLTELADRFEIAAVADLDAGSARACAGQYRVPLVFTDWREMLRHPLDAVMVLTSGSHAPIAVAAAQAGMAVFVEKPMCFSVAEGREMVAAAEQAGVTLMVGYPKRYDPAFTRFQKEAAQLSEARLMRVTTFESPIAAYVGHYSLLPREPPPADVLRRFRDDNDRRVRAAIGGASSLERAVYETVLLDTLVHELNAIRGVLGEPDRLDYV